MGNQTVGSYSCFRDAGSQYHGNPILGDPADSVNGGLALGTTRILIGYDRVLVAGLTLGVRLGYVLRGLGPRADGGTNPFPFHVEGRLAYWFGSEAFTTATFRPYVFVAGGAAQIDTRFGIVVTEDTTVQPSPNQPLCPANLPAGVVAVGCNPPAQHLDAYRRMGQGFAGRRRRLHGRVRARHRHVPRRQVHAPLPHRRQRPLSRARPRHRVLTLGDPERGPQRDSRDSRGGLEISRPSASFSSG